ncbi:Gfo/Idh/MocA family oxidoreductase [candidate division KSB1 bacterium]|nr:Gfo/Idh/MocA family oxidoreductase [candidate division KSB1 bacterium]
MIRIGIIGAGYWGPNVVRNFYQIDGSSVVRLADLNEARLEFIKGLYPDIHLGIDYREILNDTTIDAIYIATPVSTHHTIAMAALKAAKHVLVEKPMCKTVDEAEQLVDMARAKNKILSVGHIFQYTPAVNAINNIITSGEIGDILYFDSTRINMGPPATEVDVMWDLAPHDLSILFHLVNDKPVSVRAVGNSYAWKDKSINDMTYLHINFDTGKRAQIHVSWLSANKTRMTRIFAEKGSVEYDETRNPKVIVYGEGIDNRVNLKESQTKKLAYGVGTVSTPELENYEPLRKECEEFLHAIVMGRQTVSNGTVGLKVVQVLEAATKSIEYNGREIKL